MISSRSNYPQTVHLSCCLVLDLPQLVRGGRAAMQSLPFKRLMDNQAKASFIGPPETVRDHIMAGARALLQGDWELAMSYVSALKAWDLLPQKANAMEMLREQLKKTALKASLGVYVSWGIAVAQVGVCVDGR